MLVPAGPLLVPSSGPESHSFSVGTRGLDWMIYGTGVSLKCQETEPATPSKIATLVIVQRRFCLIKWNN